jgi:hypothetical protein
MIINFDNDGIITEWFFSRKGYKKARWRRKGQRWLDYNIKTFPGFSGTIIVIS